MRIGTRGSRLALWQAEHVAGRLRAAGLDAALETFSTEGDRRLDVPLSEIGTKGLFTEALDEALLDGRIDVAVHSLKDLPTRLPEGLVLAAVTERADPRDAFVPHPAYGGGVEALPKGAVIATSSLRRRAQLLGRRPDLNVVSVRGNVPTRIDKLDGSGAPGAGGWHGLLLAAAGLDRLALSDRVGERLDPAWMLPAVGQGALGVVCAADRPDACAAVAAALDHAPTRAACLAERAFLRRLEGGCQIPIAALARVESDAVGLDGAVASLDGRQLLRASARGAAADPEAVGLTLAERLLGQGAEAILAAIRSDG